MALTELTLDWPEYRLFPYERDLALRETRVLLKPFGDIAVNGSVQVRTRHPRLASRLTYFNTVRIKGCITQTIQQRLERGGQTMAGTAPRRQATRYSVHGLHEYKGKFNPQVAKAIINYLNLEKGHLLDPFCGSGTTLVECAHVGASAVGCDQNPLAVMITQAKLSALAIPASDILAAMKSAVRAVSSGRVPAPDVDDARTEYLRKWFPDESFQTLETLRAAISREHSEVQPVLSLIASNLLRDYSLQEPADLRIRRRKSRLPTTPLMEEFVRLSEKMCSSIAAAQDVLGEVKPSCRAVLEDSASLTLRKLGIRKMFDGAITSPPYATALPYIDTQRLSLTWLGLVAPKELPQLQATLIGSREFYGEYDRGWNARLLENADKVPRPMHDICINLRNSVSNTDGFRRRAVPTLLYRYMVGMRSMFRSVNTVLKHGAPFALIVGHNHTKIGGKRFEIDTPDILGGLAASVGYTVEECIELQTYQRFGLHQHNAVAREKLLILRKQ